MTVNQAAQRATSAGAGSTMAVRATDPVLTIIVLGRASIGARLSDEPGVRVVRASSPFDALGELGFLDPAHPSPLLVIDLAELAPEEIPAFVAAAKRVEPGVRIIGAGEPARITAVESWIAADAGAADWSRVIHPKAADRPHLVPEDEPPSPAPATDESWADDDAALTALLAGRDLLGPILARVRRAFTPHEVRLQPVIEGNSDPTTRANTPGETSVVIQHRGRTLGWLIGPASIREQLLPAARWLALWLAVQEQHATLRTAALTDALTGAWNRRYFDRFIDSVLSRAKRKRNDVTLLLFDIDDFKSYNDRFGHSAGDGILREVVRLLGSVIRPTDRVCRIGGDEFAVVFDAPDPGAPGRDPASRHPALIVEIARRFQKQIQAHHFPKLGEAAAGSLGISAGLATFPWDASDARGLVEIADRHLLESKRQGKNRLTLGPPSI